MFGVTELFESNSQHESKGSSMPLAQAKNSAENALEIKDLDMVFSRGTSVVHALNDINLNVTSGEFLSIVGPSGCGKSTMMKLVAGLRKPTRGEIKILGQTVDGPRSDVGIVFQNPVLLPWRTILENLLLPVDILKLDKVKATKKAHELLELVGLTGFDKSYPNELSGGMQQRAAIARALVYDAPILMMDEPFGALDAMTREQMNVELQRIWMESGKTIVFITHSIPEAVFLADHVVVMSPRPGRVLATYQIELPRTRSLDDMATPAYGKYVKEIRALLGQDETGERNDNQSNW
jgi:NitT/TauT family transport system ATP-binding protein